jgi:hypothetical protein
MEGTASRTSKARLTDAVRDNENNSPQCTNIEGMASHASKAGLIDANAVPTSSSSSLRYVCYLALNKLCRFGTVYRFIHAPRMHVQYMLVRPWKDIEADVHKHQIVYQRTNGGLEIVAVQRIRCLVGILTELDRRDRRGRHTTMILGALHEVRLAGGINPADLRS